MWLFTKVGFFSVVTAKEPKPELGAMGDVLSVRARIDGDLEKLRAAYAPELGETVLLPGRDYPFRAYITKESWAEAMCRAALDTDYDNFKNMITEEFGHPRHDLYTRVWGVMYGQDEKVGALEKKAKKAKR